MNEVDSWHETVGQIAASKECPKCKSRNIKKTYRNDPKGLNCAYVTYCGDCNYEIIAILLRRNYVTD